MHTQPPIPGVSFHFVEVNGIRMRLATAGEEGPLVVLVHGWPESWFSWRHQIQALAEAGCRVVAPDMRGYGSTDAPPAVEDYDIRQLAGDIVGIVDALGEEKAVLVGHDWGAIVAWHTALLHPHRFAGLVAMSVPYRGRPTRPDDETWKEKFGDRFFYVLYHQTPGVAEAEYDADPYGLLLRLYQSPGAPREAPEITDRHYQAGGWLKRLGKPKALPDWLTEDELDYFAVELRRAGFRGGLNYYRNLRRNWEITTELEGATVEMPTLFIGGAGDSVLAGATREQLVDTLGTVCQDLRDVVLLPEAGHWIQQERPQEVNAALLSFVKALS